jgi:hypothetical protein
MAPSSVLHGGRLLKKPSRSEGERVGKINKSVKKYGLETQKGNSISTLIFTKIKPSD